MVIFHSYVSLPEGSVCLTIWHTPPQPFFQRENDGVTQEAQPSPPPVVPKEVPLATKEEAEMKEADEQLLGLWR
jgi:hypothetical protein